LLYTLELSNILPYDFYYSHSTQYSAEELLMAAIQSKQNICDEVLDFYNANLQIKIKISNGLQDGIPVNIYAIIDYKTKDVCMATFTEHGPLNYCMYGKQNASKCSSKNEKFINEIEPSLRYMMIMNYQDIIELNTNIFSKICMTDSQIHQLIEKFKEEHKKE